MGGGAGEDAKRGVRLRRGECEVYIYGSRAEGGDVRMSAGVERMVRCMPFEFAQVGYLETCGRVLGVETGGVCGVSWVFVRVLWRNRCP